MASFEDFINAFVKPAEGEFIVLKDLTNAFTEWRQSITFGPPMQINDLYYAEERSKDIFPAESYESAHLVQNKDGNVVSYNNCVKGWKLLSPPSNPVEGEEVLAPPQQSAVSDVGANINDDTDIHPGLDKQSNVLAEIKQDQRVMKASIDSVSDIAITLHEDMCILKTGLNSIEASLTRMHAQLNTMENDVVKSVKTHHGWIDRLSSYFK